MLDRPDIATLTTLEKLVYRSVFYTAIAGLFICILMVRRSSTGSMRLIANVFGFVFLLTGVTFGWGYNKNVRVLDLRTFGKR